MYPGVSRGMRKNIVVLSNAAQLTPQKPLCNQPAGLSARQLYRCESLSCPLCLSCLGPLHQYGSSSNSPLWPGTHTETCCSLTQIIHTPCTVMFSLQAVQSL